MADTTREVVDLISDSEDDEDLKRAIALSLQDQKCINEPAEDAHVANRGKSSDVKSGGDSPKPVGILALDRKQMESDRLARLTKRQREASEQGQEDVVGIAPPKKRMQTGISNTLSGAKILESSAPSSSSASSKSSSQMSFPSGVVKRTWAYGYPRTSEDIKIEEIFQRDQLQLAILSSFQWDEEWLLSKVDLGRTKLLLVAYAPDEAQKQAMRDNAPSNIRFCFPPMNGPGAMHSKLQILKFPDYLRIVIPTGNLVPYDWGETGVMENMLFLIDVPRLANSTSHSPTRFSTQLDHFLRASAIDEKMVASLRSYDFSATAGLGFIYSIPGGHSDEALFNTGYCGLGGCAAALGIKPGDHVDVDLVCSSLGSLDPEFIQAIYNACQGDDGMSEYNARVRRKPAQRPVLPSQTLIDHFRIYFPTDKTVCASRGGKGAGGTICAQAKWWRAPSFPRQLLRDCINTREGLLMHSKVIFVRCTRRTAQTPTNESGQCIDGFAYVGSANLSESAWGRVVKERGTGKPKINCRNWECGVVLPVVRKPASNSADGLGIFADYVPVPMRFPGPRYGPNEDPWFFLET